jgi:hypothetical protein
MKPLFSPALRRRIAYARQKSVVADTLLNAVLTLFLVWNLAVLFEMLP